jgi:BlaI family penicillinase repressor
MDGSERIADMADDPRPPMSDAERAVLVALWEQGPKTVRDMHALLEGQGQRWTRSTVITLLQRLERKGYVASDKDQPAFVFRAAVSREEVMHQRLAELADELAEGDALPLLLAFAERHKFTPAEIARFQQIIDEARAKSSRRKSSP